MKPIHTAMIAASSLGLLASCSQDAAADAPCPVAGRYAVAGQQPGGGGQYAGEAVISETPAGCSMRWLPPNDSAGTGTFANGVLTIRFTFADGGTGQVQYTRAASGELNGLWWLDGDEGNKGTENLRPL
jgi:hypothetical protein